MCSATPSLRKVEVIPVVAIENTSAVRRLRYPSLSDSNAGNVLPSPRENQVLDITRTYCHPLPSFPGDQRYVTHIQ